LVKGFLTMNRISAILHNIPFLVQEGELRMRAEINNSLVTSFLLPDLIDGQAGYYKPVGSVDPNI